MFLFGFICYRLFCGIFLLWEIILHVHQYYNFLNSQTHTCVCVFYTHGGMALEQCDPHVVSLWCGPVVCVWTTCLPCEDSQVGIICEQHVVHTVRRCHVGGGCVLASSCWMVSLPCCTPVFSMYSRCGEDCLLLVRYFLDFISILHFHRCHMLLLSIYALH